VQQVLQVCAGRAAGGHPCRSFITARPHMHDLLPSRPEARLGLGQQVGELQRVDLGGQDEVVLGQAACAPRARDAALRERPASRTFTNPRASHSLLHICGLGRSPP